MAFATFPKQQLAKIAGTAELVRLGAAKPGRHLELAHVQLGLYKHGAAGGSEQLRVNVYSDSGYQVAYAQSAWVSLASIPGLATYWIGRVRFDFARQPLNKNLTYYLALETQSYARSGDNFYLATLLDWPLPVNANLDAPRYAGAFALYGYTDL